ncbi:MAG: hypothetical protein QOJ58_5257 [Alphaproteobacteria bacterium]|nr:hypothetical protein [Alphaproteobacteria bacterium]
MLEPQDITGSGPMSSAERAELGKLVRLRGRVAKTDIEARQATLIADAEAQLTVIYDARDAAWSDLTTRASKLVAEADAELATRCEELGIPEEFRPRMSTSFWGRSIDKERRTELRRLVRVRLEASARAAKVEIDRATADLLTTLAAGSLTSTESKDFLESMPSIATLMPKLDVPELANTLPKSTTRDYTY